MNKKIFTLLVGALLVMSSLFTASAQPARPTVNQKDIDGLSDAREGRIDVAFADTLRADTVRYLVDKTKSAYYLLSITDIANPTEPVVTEFGEQMNYGSSAPRPRSTDSSYVMFVDGEGGLRIDLLANLDFKKDSANYGFEYLSDKRNDYVGNRKPSHKFGAIQQASWCVQYEVSNGVTGSNVVYDFVNMKTGAMLEAPLRSMDVERWKKPLFEGHDRYIYKGKEHLDGYNNIDTSLNIVKNQDLIVSGWHFSQTYRPNQLLQTSMPIYSYTQKDSVVVLVLDDETLFYDAPNDTTNQGGWKVTVKQVAVNDLISNETGHVRLDNRPVTHLSGKDPVKNVLLFTLKKIEKFVLNAHDYNAVFDILNFNADALNTKANNEGWNPFTENKSVNDNLQNPHGNGLLKAFEVNDSLYRYGYMQFYTVDNRFRENTRPYNGTSTKAATNGWLYVDTAFMNYGNEDFLKFNYSSSRRDTGWTSPYYAPNNYVSEGMKWGSSFVPGAYALQLVLADTLAKGLAKGFVLDTAFYFSKANPAYQMGSGSNPTDSINRMRMLTIDSVNFTIAYNTDSLMENQSKFRVVYDPFEDSTYINVYQTRVRYTNYANVNNPERPAWWTNSFALRGDSLARPSDWWISTFPGGNANDVYYSHWASWSPSHPDIYTNPRDGDNYYHSFNARYEKSSPSEMPQVMISTADTSVFFVDGQPLSHIYGWRNQTNGQGYLYRDSLFYVDIQNLESEGNVRIATIDQSRLANQKRLDSHISIAHAVGCNQEDADPKATIENDLYLIRNSNGEYLSVPIWSLTDSVFWVTPDQWEDPTMMPSYQWTVENKRATKGSPFTLTNREFEKVSFDWVQVYEKGDRSFIVGDEDHRNANFIKRGIIRAGEIPKNKALGQREFARVKEFSTANYSFIPLNKEVKSDQLLGYTYVDPDSTIVDVYALKYLHFLATGADAPYLGWNGFMNPKVDTVVYANAQEYHDKLYFALQEMPYETIGDLDRLVIGYDEDGKKLPSVRKLKSDPTKDTYDIDNYASIYERFGNKTNNHTNRDSLVLENFGYMPTKLNATGDNVYDPLAIADLKPLARQAYRLLLKDYYKYAPTIRGDYMTVGQQDNYILSDRAYATRPYVEGSGRAEGLFGIPHFYFRNTYFGYPGVDKNGDVIPGGEDYFALVHRLDTITKWEGRTTSIQSVEKYIEMQFGDATLAENLRKQVEKSGELGVFIAVVSDNQGKLKIALRGDAGIRLSTFTLERDDDPIYRRFHWNDKFERTQIDEPLTLEFHRMNNPSMKLYENNGSDRRSGGGYEYNLNKENGELYKDSLGNIISFLGIKNTYQFPSVSAEGNPHGNTNYAIYVDTAFIRRGTGWIKPQYMFVVDPVVVDPCEICEANTRQDFRGYTVGRYMFNTAMYAKDIKPSAGDKDKYKGTGGINYDLVQPVDVEVYREAINGVTGHAYTETTSPSNKWERLAFSWAIHRGDSLYILKGAAPEYMGREYDTQVLIDRLGVEYGGSSTKNNIDFDKLIAMKGKSMDAVRADGKTIGLHAIIDLGDNTHKDWVFSLRFIYRNDDSFVIESETTERDRVNGPVIRPGYGGWVKYQNNVPTITRADSKELMVEAEPFNVNFTDVRSVSNDNVESASAVTVIGGNGSVTILNATGKNVVVSNVLGQTLANTKLNSDNASISLPTGVAVVAVEGESAVKVVVK